MTEAQYPSPMCVYICTHMQFVRLSGLLHSNKQSQKWPDILLNHYSHSSSNSIVPQAIGAPGHCTPDHWSSLTQPGTTWSPAWPRRPSLASVRGGKQAPSVPTSPPHQGLSPLRVLHKGQLSSRRWRQSSPVWLSPKSRGQEMVKDRTQTMAIITVTRRLEL